LLTGRGRRGGRERKDIIFGWKSVRQQKTAPKGFDRPCRLGKDQNRSKKNTLAGERVAGGGKRRKIGKKKIPTIELPPLKKDQVRSADGGKRKRIRRYGNKEGKSSNRRIGNIVAVTNRWVHWARQGSELGGGPLQPRGKQDRKTIWGEEYSRMSVLWTSFFSMSLLTTKPGRNLRKEDIKGKKGLSNKKWEKIEIR